MASVRKLSRRGFLKGAAAAAGLALSARSYARVVGANDRIHMAIIGCGGIAGHHLGKLLEMREPANLDITAVCDVYRTRAEEFHGKIGEAGGNARLHQYPAAVLGQDDVDYVLIATPEHSHARLALEALEAGKHVYVEKPMTHTIAEAQQVAEAVKASGLKLQVGVQGMADDSYASAYQAIRDGKLGQVVQAQIDYVRNYPPDKGPWRLDTDSTMPKPDDLDWVAWQNPAPQRPWDPHRYFEWRNFREYSGGVATDLFVHRITRLLKACGLGFPSRVTGMGGIYVWPEGRELPDNFEMLCEYPEVEGITKGMTVHILGTMANDTPNPHCIRGTKATLTFTSKGWEIKAQGSGDIVATHEKTGAEDVALHHANLHAAIREGAPLNCPAELGWYAVAAVCMGNESWFQRRMMVWDDARKDAMPA